MKDETKERVEKRLILEPPGSIPFSVTWVDGRTLFKHNKKYSKAYYGICGHSRGVFAVTPLDWQRVTMLTTIMVEPLLMYCERADSCLNFTCLINKFDKASYVKEFKDVGAFSLGLPLNIGSKPLWWSEGKYRDFWGKLILPGTGGILKFDGKQKEIGD